MDEKKVFLNCPFDAAYKPIFDSIIFAIHDLGFEARHALIDNGNAVRLLRISGEIQSCKYSIHDISRVESGGSLRLPRFNMPFEAGLGYLLHETSVEPNKHHCLLLDSESYRYHASLSDVAGLDAKIHGGSQQKAISAVRSFLVAKSGAQASFQGGAHIWKRFNLFQQLLKSPAKARNISLRELKSWSYVNDLQAMMAEWTGNNIP
ncbi:hypothetical protein [Xanthomonas phaseoli]|uniref:hypothetical protein n=1 Tax=Xanthomonas phaseoli TaxID=1985254 RepID=UPI001267113F|nr:hypothetical protein [Xanthomonas phaseoli]